MNRKSFLTKVGAVSTFLAGAPYVNVLGKDNAHYLEYNKEGYRTFNANEHINIALIGAGGMGQGNGATALEHNGVKLVAVCDLYDSRLTRCKERWGKDHDIFFTKDYREVLDRDDVDAVIISTSDHWHDVQAIDALNANKAVFLEKPMVQHVEQGHSVIQAEKNTGNILQVGSQLTSSILYKKAGELIQSGEIGELNFVEGSYDRYSAGGAWQYSIPPGVTAEEVDWETYLKDLPYREFDPKQFFRWRNYQDFGTGAAGDLFVHLLSAVHLVTDSKGPGSIMSTGGLRFWHDGRDVPDVQLGLLDYQASDSHPAFNLALRVNFIDGSGGGEITRFVGSGGEVSVSGSRLTLRKAELDDRPPVTIGDFSEQTQEDYMAYYNENYPEAPPQVIAPSELVYRAPDGYNMRYDHFGNFFASIRDNKPVYQNGTVGLRAAAPALLSNKSYLEQRIIHWDPENIKILEHAT